MSIDIDASGRNRFSKPNWSLHRWASNFPHHAGAAIGIPRMPSTYWTNLSPASAAAMRSSTASFVDLNRVNQCFRQTGVPLTLSSRSQHRASCPRQMPRRPCHQSNPEEDRSTQPISESWRISFGITNQCETYSSNPVPLRVLFAGLAGKSSNLAFALSIVSAV